MSTPTSTPFPTKLSDLVPADTTTNPTIYTTLKHLKKSTLSIHNRLTSILHDSTYITTQIHGSHHFSHLPIIANERCGSWYVPPDLKTGSAYFKSTDGHYGSWDFSLRRLNLQVLECVAGNGGAVVVDSTRRGKRMPDALRRTVPIWVLVWNWVLFGEMVGKVGRNWEWAFELQHPGLELAEVRLIEAKLGRWVDGLKGLGLDLKELRRKVVRPMRLCWVVHGEEVVVPGVDGVGDGGGLRRDEYNLLVLCSASRPVVGAEMSEDGYVQGAADDAEGWSSGLTSAVFWQYQDRLMAAAEEELSDLITALVTESKAVSAQVAATRIEPTRNMFVSATPSASEDWIVEGYDLVIVCNGRPAADTSDVVNLRCRTGKLGSKDLRVKLPLAVDRISALLKNNGEGKVLVVCEDGKDLGIGVTVAVLSLLYNDQGQNMSPNMSAVDKQLIKKRLAWITSVKPDANPSRSTLQAVNSFLM